MTLISKGGSRGGQSVNGVKDEECGNWMSLYVFTNPFT